MRLLSQSVVRQPRSFERLSLSGGRFIESRCKKASQHLGIFCIGYRCLNGALLGKLTNLKSRYRAVEHAEVIHKATLESMVSHPLANPNVVTPATCDLASEIISHHFCCCHMAVHKNLQTRCLARAVTGHRHVHPLTER